MLVVDAEPLCQWALQEALTAAGFAASTMSPEPPFQAVDDVDVLILDATLAGAGSLRVLEHVRARNPRCRVLLLTAFDSVGYARLSESSPLWRAIQKPFEIAVVVDTVAELSSAPVRPIAV